MLVQIQLMVMPGEVLRYRKHKAEISLRFCGNGIAVIALFDRQQEEIPDTLEIKRGKKVMTVPLVARVAKKFKAE